jgi:hypothetical protein
VVTDEREIQPSCFFARMKRASAIAGARFEDPVRVLAAQRVAGYDAVVLEADDPAALSQWLRDHGYDSRPELRDWLTPYVENKWKLTAFKLGSDQNSASVQSAAVRMTFLAFEPFFPYREPKNTHESSNRRLRVYTFSSVGRMAGRLGKEGFWPGAVSYAHAAEGAVPGAVQQAVPDYTGPLPSGWLTRFDDDSNPRPGGDEVYFATATDPKEEAAPPPVIMPRPRIVYIPVDIIAIAFMLVGAVSFVARRWRRPPQPD